MRPFDIDKPPPLGPESQLGLLGEWFRKKNRGRNAALPLPNTGAQNLLESIGEDALACGVTIACHVEQQTTANPNDRPSIVGTLSWGTDGAQHNADFDFVNGVQLNVAGSYVELTARVDTDAPGNGEVDRGFQPVKVFATLSYLPPSTRTPVRTRYLAFVGAGALSISVPLFARDFVLLKSVAAVTVQVEQVDRAGTTVVLEGPTAGQVAQVLANDCRTLKVTASAAALVRVMFSLYL